MDYETIKREFEKAAIKKGYVLAKDEYDRYEDCYLQEAWEVFNLVDLKAITRN